MSLLVVGAGPARIAPALQARELGAEVTVLEADQAGGTSLNRGPAPVRTLARAARLMRDWSSWAGFGPEGGPPTHVEQSAELQLAYPTFTEAVSVAAQMVCRTLGIGRFQQVWSYLGSDE